jgi:hypothetical protein
LFFHRNTAHDVLSGLVREFEILLDIYMVLDLEEDNGGGNQKTPKEKAPTRGKLGHERGFIKIQAAKISC